MPRGGPRPGAGRKSNADIETARKLIASAVSDDDWREVFQGLAAAAKKGNHQAASLLMGYAFGLPSARVEMDVDAMIMVVLDE